MPLFLILVLKMTVAEYAALYSKETSTFHYTCSKSKDKHGRKRRNTNEIPETHAAIAVTTYLSYSVLILIGHIRDFLRKLGLMKHGKSAVKDVSQLYCTIVTVHFSST